MIKKKRTVSKQKNRLVATFKHSVNVEVIQPAFEPLASAKVLDLAKLSQGNHRIEVGWLKGGCCPKLVYARISKGMIQNLEVEPCEEAEVAVPEEIVAVFAEARKRIKDPTDWKPIPVQDIAMIWDGYPTRWGTGACCFYLCVWHYCLFCCASGVCWIERRKPDVIM